MTTTPEPFDWRTHMQNAAELLCAQPEDFTAEGFMKPGVIARIRWERNEPTPRYLAFALTEASAHRTGWCILANSGDCYWVADGAYAEHETALQQADWLSAHPEQGDRDWYDLGRWRMNPAASTAEAITVALERLAFRYVQFHWGSVR